MILHDPAATNSRLDCARHNICHLDLWKAFLNRLEQLLDFLCQTCYFGVAKFLAANLLSTLQVVSISLQQPMKDILAVLTKPHAQPTKNNSLKKHRDLILETRYPIKTRVSLTGVQDSRMFGIWRLPCGSHPCPAGRSPHCCQRYCPCEDQ